MKHNELEALCGAEIYSHVLYCAPLQVKEVWVMSCKLQDFLTGFLQFNQALMSNNWE